MNKEEIDQTISKLCNRINKLCDSEKQHDSEIAGLTNSLAALITARCNVVENPLRQTIVTVDGKEVAKSMQDDIKKTLDEVMGKGEIVD